MTNWKVKIYAKTGGALSLCWFTRHRFLYALYASTLYSFKSILWKLNVTKVAHNRIWACCICKKSKVEWWCCLTGALSCDLLNGWAWITILSLSSWWTCILLTSFTITNPIRNVNNATIICLSFMLGFPFMGTKKQIKILPGNTYMLVFAHVKHLKT